MPTPWICRLPIGSFIAKIVRSFATPIGYLNVRHSYADSLDKNPKRGNSSHSLICSHNCETLKLATCSLLTLRAGGSAVRTSFSSPKSQSLLHSWREPFQTAKKTSSKGRKSDARWCRPRVIWGSRDGLEGVIWRVIGRLRRMPWALIVYEHIWPIDVNLDTHLSETTSTQNKHL